MPDLDVALRLWLINGFKANSAETKRADIGAAARGLGTVGGIELLSRNLEEAIVRAKHLER